MNADQVHDIAARLIARPKYAEYTTDDFEEAREIFAEEFRARYDADEDGDFDEYMTAKDKIFQREWDKHRSAARAA